MKFFKIKACSDRIVSISGTINSSSESRRFLEKLNATPVDDGGGPHLKVNILILKFSRRSISTSCYNAGSTFLSSL